MAHAGARERLPVDGLDRALVADRQGDQHPGIAVLGQRVPELRADPLAGALDRVRGRPHHRRELRPLAARPDVPGRADPALEQRRLVVEAVRVRIAVRKAQTDGQPPALAGADREDLLELLGREAVVPGEQDPRRRAKALGRGLLDVELEAHAALEGLRQARDDPGQRDVASLPARIESVGHAELRCAGREGEAEAEARERDERARGRL